MHLTSDGFSPRRSSSEKPSKEAPESSQTNDNIEEKQ
jgi:hypothetical protein